jgi:hypothetical protein
VNPEKFKRRCIRIREIGCLACRRVGFYTVPEVHHLNLGAHAGQVRRGDEFTIGLCPYHHQGRPHPAFLPDQVRDILGPSLAKAPNTFRQVFGSDDALLAWQNELLERTEKNRVSAWLT